jgi:hypothetical protein
MTPIALNTSIAPEVKAVQTLSMALNDEKLGTKRKIVCFSGMLPVPVKFGI